MFNLASLEVNTWMSCLSLWYMKSQRCGQVYHVASFTKEGLLQFQGCSRVCEASSASFAGYSRYEC